MANKYDQFKKLTLFKEEFVFIVSLYKFLNEKFELENIFDGHLQFEMSYSNFQINFLRKLEHYAKNSCGVVCPSTTNECDGHRALKYLQQYEEFMIYNVEERNIFYKNSIIKQGKNTDPLMGYIFIPKDMINLKGKTWSQRLAYLN